MAASSSSRQGLDFWLCHIVHGVEIDCCGHVCTHGDVCGDIRSIGSFVLPAAACSISLRLRVWCFLELFQSMSRVRIGGEGRVHRAGEEKQRVIELLPPLVNLGAHVVDESRLIDVMFSVKHMSG